MLSSPPLLFRNGVDAGNVCHQEKTETAPVLLLNSADSECLLKAPIGLFKNEIISRSI